MDMSLNAQKRINQGNDILNRLSGLNIDGISKLKNKIKQEINFLQKVNLETNPNHKRILFKY